MLRSWHNPHSQVGSLAVFLRFKIAVVLVLVREMSRNWTSELSFVGDIFSTILKHVLSFTTLNFPNTILSFSRNITISRVFPWETETEIVYTVNMKSKHTRRARLFADQDGSSTLRSVSRLKNFLLRKTLPHLNTVSAT